MTGTSRTAIDASSLLCMTLFTGCVGSIRLPSEAASTAQGLPEAPTGSYLLVPEGEPASTGTWVAAFQGVDGEVELVGGERVGSLASSWFVDLDGDGLSEWLAVFRSVGSGSYAQIQVARQTPEGPVISELPGLLGSQLVGYAGHDQVNCTGGVLTRTHLIYLHGDANAKPSGGQVTYQFDFDSECRARVE